MVAIALMLMLMGIAVFIFLNAVKIFSRTSAETQIYQAAKIAMDMIRKEIRATKPLLTPSGTPNNQQLILLFDPPDSTPGIPWRFDRISFRTTTVDPATGQSATRWVAYWVQGGDKTAGRTGTLMKYVSPDLDIPPQTTATWPPFLAATPPAAPTDWGGLGWSTDGAEVCQQVSFFGVDVFYDPDIDANTIGDFFSDATSSPGGIRSYGSYNPLFDAYCLAAPLPSSLRLSACSAYQTGYDLLTSQIRLPSQLRVTLRVRDDKQHEERTIQEQVWIPTAD